ncbi:tetratricopeptide repeat protein, partial [Desulfatiferula olefinivorans]
YKRAISALNSKQNDVAKKYFDEIYVEKPDYPNVSYHYGKLLKDDGQFEKAIMVLESVPANETYVDLDYMRGWLYYELNNFSKAKICLINSQTELTPNDNRYYMAVALLTYIEHRNNNLIESTYSFCDMIDGVLAMEKSPKYTSQTKVPTSEIHRWVDKDFALRTAGFFILMKAIESEFKNKEFSSVLDLFIRSVKYFDCPPLKLYIKYSDQDYCKLLEMITICLSSSTLSNSQKLKSSINKIKLKNKDKFIKIFELTSLIDMIYFGVNKPITLENDYFLLFHKNINSNQPLYRVALSLNGLSKKAIEYFPDGQLSYELQEKIELQKGLNLNNCSAEISICNIISKCSETAIIYPYIVEHK